MSYDLQLEMFKNIYDFDKIINSRCNNSVMSDCHSSQKHDSWSGTSTYEEAEDMLIKGWSCKVDEMKNELGKYSNLVERARIKRKANVAGYSPIVPAAIKGVPKAMWTDIKQKRNEKRRCIHIYFNNTGSSVEDEDDLMKAGMAVLKLCILLEKHGIKCKIDALPFVAEWRNSVYGCGISIKDYQQPFNLQKMAYPIAHTSMFRRQGFKWLETMLNCKESGFSGGYGRPLESTDKERAFKEKFKLNEKGSVYITYYDCKRCDFNPESLAENKGIFIQEVK